MGMVASQPPRVKTSPNVGRRLAFGLAIAVTALALATSFKAFGLLLIGAVAACIAALVIRRRLEALARFELADHLAVAAIVPRRGWSGGKTVFAVLSIVVLGLVAFVVVSYLFVGNAGFTGGRPAPDVAPPAGHCNKPLFEFQQEPTDARRFALVLYCAKRQPRIVGHYNSYRESPFFLAVLAGTAADALDVRVRDLREATFIAPINTPAQAQVNGGWAGWTVSPYDGVGFDYASAPIDVLMPILKPFVHVTSVAAFAWVLAGLILTFALTTVGSIVGDALKAWLKGHLAWAKSTSPEA